MNNIPQTGAASARLLQSLRLVAVLPAVVLLAVSGSVLAQAFPSKPIRVVVPAAPGGGTDILARLLSPKLTEQFGQSIVIENRAGGATMIGTEFVARSAPDGLPW